MAFSINRPVLDFNAAEADRIALGIKSIADFIEPIVDSFAQCFVRVVDGADGDAEVQCRSFGDLFPEVAFATAMTLVGVMAAEVPEPAFII